MTRTIERWIVRIDDADGDGGLDRPYTASIYHAGADGLTFSEPMDTAFGATVGDALVELGIYLNEGIVWSGDPEAEE